MSHASLKLDAPALQKSILEVAEPAPEEAAAADAIRTAVGAVAMHANGEAVLHLSNERIGALMRAGVARLLALTRPETGVAQLDVETGRASPPGSPSASSGCRSAPVDAPSEISASTARPTWEDVVNPERILAGRQALVKSGKLIPAKVMRNALSISRQSLGEAVKTGCMFTVDVGTAVYYPAFYVYGDIDLRLLEAVTKRLGKLPGWSKWQFFTTRSVYLHERTPLEALARGHVDEVKKLADGFLSR